MEQKVTPIDTKFSTQNVPPRRGTRPSCASCSTVALRRTSNSERTNCSECEAAYYWSGVEVDATTGTLGTCLPCEDSVVCDQGSGVTEWTMKEGFWRSTLYSKDVHECKPGHCLSTAANSTAVQINGNDHYLSNVIVL